tara:strand:- start:3595 stop:3858 length:264 start_codon:yes stop_codon:yes gene_type:complete
MHENSLKAYREEGKKLSQRARQILAFFENAGPAWFTDREVKHGLEFEEMNQVRPRITELIERGILEEVGKTKCTLTKKQVRLVGLVR